MVVEDSDMGHRGQLPRVKRRVSSKAPFRQGLPLSVSLKVSDFHFYTFTKALLTINAEILI